MGRELTDPELRSLLGVYAIGALDDDEREQVEELLLRDSSARAELHTLQLGVAWLDHASTGAPMHVWRDISAEIEPERRDIAPVARIGDWRRTRSFPRWFLGVAAAVVFGLVVAGGVLVVRDNGASGPKSVTALAAAAARQPGGRTVPLVAGDGSRVGTVVVASNDAAYVVWSEPPATTRSGTYQLWNLTPDGPRSAALLGGAPADVAFRVAPGASGVAVTLEPRGGSDTPTGTPLVSATFA